MACNCGFHVVKPANAPQSVASVSAPGATPSAQRTFLRPPPSLSMANISLYTKSRFSGSQSASLKPHLVARKSPSSSPPSTILCEDLHACSILCQFSLYILCEDLHACSILCQFSLYILCEDLHACSILCLFSLYILCEDLHACSIPCEHCCKHHPGSRLCEMSLEEMSQPLLLQLHSGCLGMSKAIPVQDPEPPMPDRFFTHRLMVWMPYHLWKREGVLPNMWEAADGRGQTVRDQLDLPHQKMFRLILTPQITKKLSGHAKGTALWVTSIGNEVGQIVTSVLTVQEGPALDTMVLWCDGAVSPGSCSTPSAAAKRALLVQEGVPGLTDQMVDGKISKKELSLYCRRRTRGEVATITLIEQLLEKLGGNNGRDLMGVPLLEQVRMEHIWRVQRRHVKCIQDVPGVQLYTVTGTTIKEWHPANKVYSRNQCKCTEFPIVPPGRPETGGTRIEGCCGRLPNTLESCLVLTTYSVRLDGLFESSLIPRRLRTWNSISSLPCPSATLSSSQPAASSLVASLPLAASSSLAAASEQAAASAHAADSLHPCASSLTVAPSLPSLSATSSRPSAYSQPPASMPQPGVSSALDSAPPDESGAVDDSGMAGMDRVYSFAECLVELRNQLTMVLTNQQVSNIVALWQNLLDYDKQRVVFAARHQSRLDTGRFRLCVIYRSPRKRGTGTVSRWDLILEDYRKIRRRILSNGTVMQQTTLQLVDVCHTTLVQWHNKRV
ncbi:hypothetical protein JOQ06_007529 [Pogonophryne albipinna]|uniref:Uncharacterized protein n=1 Tax=Pogonophryne albipinna TaxID=1090488 RepID=A0AAD6B316_9TELE|nr:hypothetical protein JOQ06_007529 [Pogonophryne albipinna]